MRMGADRAEHVGKPLGDREQLGLPAHAGRDRHDPADAGRPGARDDGVELVGEVREIEMAVAVDQHRGSGPMFCISAARSLRARHSAGTPARAPAASCPARAAVPPPSAAKSRSSCRNAEQIEQLAGRVRHERLRQDRDLPDHLGGDVEHRALPRRIGLGQRPGRLAREIAVGVRHHGPDRVEHLVELLRLHLLARGRRSCRRRPPGSSCRCR